MGRLTLLCLLALALGVAAGLTVSRLGGDGTPPFLGVAEAIIRAWTNGFRLLVAPLVVAQLYLAMASHRASAVDAGRLSLGVPVVFAGLLIATAVVTVVSATGLLGLPYFSDLHLATAAPAMAPSATASTQAAWVDGFVPPNLIAVAATDNILPLMLFTLVFGLAVRKVEPAAQDVLKHFFLGVSQAMFIIVGWLLRVTPVVILSLGYRASLSSGLDVGEVILGFAGLEILIVLIALLVLYPVVSLASGVSLTRLARGLWPAQLTALSTRSSLATVPALLRAAEPQVGIRGDTAAYVLPLGGAVLKLSRAVTGPTKLLFLAHVLGIGLEPEQLVIFISTILLLSASTVGVPSVTAGNRSLPAFVAAGIPPEYVVLLGVAVNLTDTFLTLLNTSGYMFSAVLVDRLRGRRAPAAPLPQQASALAPAPLPVP